MANTFKFGNGNWAVKDGYALAYNDENNNFKPLPFDFTRASSATRVNKQGLIETVPSGKPRIDFLDNTSGHLLLEPSTINLTNYSAEIDRSYWGKVNASITANSDISPSGSLNADKFVENTANSSHYFYRTISSTSGTAHTLSVFAKADGRNTFRLFKDESGTQSFAFFNLANGSIGTTTNATAKIENFGNGWYRCSISFTSSSTSIYTQYLLAQDNETTSYAGDGSSGILFWGVQLERQSYPTSYIPTEGSSVTRAAEKADQTGVQQVIGQTEGTLYLEFVPLDTSALQILFQIRTTGSTNVGQVDIRFQSSQIRALGSDNNGTTVFNILGGSITAGTTYKAAIRYKTNDAKFYINGSSVGADTNCSFTSSTKQQISFSENDGLNFPALAEIKDARLYDTALTDTELQNLTS